MDQEIQALTKALEAEGMTKAAIDAEIDELRRLNRLADRVGGSTADALRQIIRTRINHLLELYPKLGRLLALMARTGFAQEITKAVGKAISLGASTTTLVFVEILFYAPEGRTRAAWGEFELVHTATMQTSGDEVHCAIVCTYRGPTRVAREGGGSTPCPSHPQSELVLVHEFDCSRPPSPQVLAQFCHRSVWSVIAD